jgi:septal ring factor EnvC (AmiA/AmiB activator)
MSDDIIAKLTEIATTQKIQNESQKEHTRKLSDHNETLARLTATVEAHHRRSILIEQDVKRIDKDINEIQTHIHKVEGAGSLIRWIAYVCGAVIALGGVLKLLGVI